MCGAFGHYNMQGKVGEAGLAIMDRRDRQTILQDEDFAMFVVIPLGVRWGDMEL